jgi:hypothetical protein
MEEDPPELRNPKAAADMAANAVSHYLKQSGITDQNEKRKWIEQVFDRVKANELDPQ